MTEAERQSRAYAEVRARLMGVPRPVNMHSTLVLKQKKNERRERIRITRWKELLRETEAHRRLKRLNLTVEAFDEIIIEMKSELQTSADGRMPMQMIARSILTEHPQYTMRDIRGPRRGQELVKVRKEMIRSIHRLRPDLSTVQIGKFVNRDHSTVVSSLGQRRRIFDVDGSEAQ